HPFSNQQRIVREPLLLLEIAAKKGPLMIENPPHAAALMLDLLSLMEVLGNALSGHNAERARLWLVKGQSHRVKRDSPVNCFRNGVKKGFLDEVRDDSVVDLQERARALLTSSQRLFRALALRYVLRKRHYKLRHALGARNQRNIVACPHQAAVFAPILLFDLELLSLSLQKICDKTTVKRSVILMRNIKKS